MKNKLCLGLFYLAVPAVIAFGAQGGGREAWKQVLSERIPLYGHRNWIVVADSAYPAQSGLGIETIISGADQIDVLQYVLKTLSAAKHIRPIVHLDRELTYVSESDAPGVQAYREQLAAILPEEKPINLLHEELISRLDKAGETFRVLIIKTNMTIPYTSVFMQLDCAYWGAEAERKLRAQMPQRPNR